jgi:hypothetical protein
MSRTLILLMLVCCLNFAFGSCTHTDFFKSKDNKNQQKDQKQSTTIHSRKGNKINFDDIFNEYPFSFERLNKTKKDKLQKDEIKTPVQKIEPKYVQHHLTDVEREKLKRLIKIFKDKLQKDEIKTPVQKIEPKNVRHHLTDVDREKLKLAWEGFSTASEQYERHIIAMVPSCKGLKSIYDFLKSHHINPPDGSILPKEENNMDCTVNLKEETFYKASSYKIDSLKTLSDEEALNAVQAQAVRALFLWKESERIDGETDFYSKYDNLYWRNE